MEQCLINQHMNRKVVWHFVTEQMHGRRKRNTLNRLFKRLKIQRINDHVRLLNDHDDGTGYLVTGTDKALVIDTMYGQEDLKEAVKTLTDLPLMLVNTHGHFDHTYGNLYFDKAYIHPADIGIAEAYFKADGFVQMMKETGRKPAEFEPITEGTVIDLGGIELEIYETPGHTPGSIVLLDRKDRILFSGDTVIEQTWMQLPECCEMNVMLQSLDRIQKLRPYFDYILCGHSHGLEDASLCEAQRQAVWEICNGQVQNDEPYVYYGGTCKAHPYGRDPRRIVYDPDKKGMDTEHLIMPDELLKVIRSSVE